MYVIFTNFEIANCSQGIMNLMLIVLFVTKGYSHINSCNGMRCSNGLLFHKKSQTWVPFSIKIFVNNMGPLFQNFQNFLSVPPITPKNFEKLDLYFEENF